MQYTFAPGSHIKANANKAGALFERLERQGRLTAQDVVDESRPEGAPLHHCFQWNDTVAAEEYRKEQARHLIRSIRIVNEQQEKKRVYFNFVQADPCYNSVETILQSPDSVELVLEKALRELIAWQNRYKEIKELFGVMREIDNAKRQLAKPAASIGASATAV